MLRGMVTLLLETGKVDTTLTRAKEVRALAEKMITLGKKNTLASRRQALAFITKEDVVKKVFDQIAPENANRNGGYTAIYKLGPRRGDGAEMARIVLVSEMEKAAAEKAAAEAKAKKGSKKKAAKKEVVEETVEAPVEETVEAPAEEAAEAPAEETAEVSAEEVAAVLENALESIDEE
jgi:large subunit ribosomal protein L17